MPKISLKLFISLLCIIGANQLKAQSTEQILDVGHSYYQKGDYLGASKIYQQAMQVDSSDAAVLYHYSKSLMKLMKMKLASRYLFKASLIDQGKEYPDIDYLLAEAYRGSGEYRKARRFYSKALVPYRRDRNSYWYKRIDQSKQANSWAMKNAATGNPELDPIDPIYNSKASEFAPRIKDSHFYFSSLRADSINEDLVVKDKDYFNRIYSSDLKLKQIPKEVKVALSEQKMLGKHLANLSFAKDGKTVYFSVCDTNYNCDIWRGEISNNQIIRPYKLNKNINFPGTNNTQAEILEHKGKEFLIFSSDRPKGFGQLDLWVAEKKDFGFDEPINLGAEVNTAGNEITPYYQEGWLYFSSDWHLGYGGYDIFKTQGWLSTFQEAENLGEPFNSPADDYYFSRANDRALIASNRLQSNSPDFCCNDIYIGSYEESEVKEMVIDTIAPDIVTLNKYLPLDLYFHNDEPDPNSQDSTTNKNYLLLAHDFLEMKTKYKKELSKADLYAKDEEMAIRLENFFEEDVVSGISDLEFFTPLLLKALEAGNQIELSIKGFASSLSGAEYNLKLTLRRIESLINYFKAYENGAFKPYLDGSANNGGALNIQKLPFGEFAIQDKSLEENKTLAVYSPQAALQRKIELIAASMQDGDKKRFDSQEVYLPPKIEFNSRDYDLGEIDQDQLSRIFLVKNKGGENLRIYNVMINCDDCAQIQFPNELKIGEEGRIEVSIDTRKMKGEVTLNLTVVSNTIPHLNELNIKLTK